LQLRLVIPYYRGSKYIEACIASLREQEIALTEVIVVDNCPEGFSSTSEILKNLPFKLTTIKAQAKIGFGRACNLGIHYALQEGCEGIVLLNQDAIMAPDALRHLTTTLSSHPKAFAVAPLAMTYDLQNFYFETIRSYVAPHLKYVRDLILQKVQNEYEVGVTGINGACLLLSSKALQEVGYFDPVFYMYGEENELFTRALMKHFKLYVCPAARIGHLHSHVRSHGEASLAIARKSSLGYRIALFKNCKGREWLTALSRILHVRNWYIHLREGGLKALFLAWKCDLKFLTLLPKVLFHRSGRCIQRDTNKHLEEDRIEIRTTALPQ
jgi:GT2 family glycosyltransferase